LIDPAYYVTELPKDGYETIRMEHYTSWLDFGKSHNVLV
jgi:hypothetical protein